MNRRLVAITGISLATVLLYANPYVMATEPVFTSGHVARAHHLLEMWLECIECDRSELHAVATLGTIAVPSLIATLKEGPSRSKREIMRRRLMSSYKQLSEHKVNHHTIKATEGATEYVAYYMENYVAQYQIRAAIALAEIGGPAARHALEEAHAAPLRKDVQRVVSESREKLQKLTP